MIDCMIKKTKKNHYDDEGEAVMVSKIKESGAVMVSKLKEQGCEGLEVESKNNNREGSRRRDQEQED